MAGEVEREALCHLSVDDIHLLLFGFSFFVKTSTCGEIKAPETLISKLKLHLPNCEPADRKTAERVLVSSDLNDGRIPSSFQRLFQKSANSAREQTFLIASSSANSRN